MPSAIGLTDRGCVRPNNEDAFLVSRELGLYIVADGMGGAEAGEVASHLAVETVSAAVGASQSRDENALREAVQEANRRVFEAATADPRLRGMGTTLTAALDNGDHILIANVGDSRAWLLSQGSLALLTSDQTWVNEIGRSLELTDQQIRTHPMRHVLTMAVGVGPEARIQVVSTPVPAEGGTLLLSSDGLHGPVTTEQIENLLGSGKSLESRAHSLIEAAKSAGGPDNITVVLLEF